MLPLAAQTNPIAIFPDEDALTPEKLKLVWPATPGLRYEVKQSTNLQSWSTAPGYPATANGPAQQMPFLTDGKARFFRLRELDEQPPAIVSQFPQDGGFAVPRFANLTLQLSDVTGIDANSIRLTVGSLGTFTLTNTNLTWTNGLLTFINGGSIPLGGWGSNVLASLIVADTLGNRGTNTWSFKLEVQPQVVTNLFVFGSPQAQRAGQRIGNIPTAALAARFGPIPMSDGDPWTLELVESNRLVVSYTNTAPGFATNTYVCNLTPVRPADIFNRKITGITNDPGNKRLTLFTIDVALGQMVTNGSATLSPSSVIYQIGPNSTISRVFSFDYQMTFDSIGVDTNVTLFDQDGVTLTLEEAKFLFTPSLALSLEIGWFELQRFESTLSGRLETAIVPQLTITGDLSDTNQCELFSHWWLIYVGQIGPIPVWLEFNFGVTAEVGYNLSANATMSTGVRQNVDMGFGVDYVKGRSPELQGHPFVNPEPIDPIPFTYQINGSASAYAKITPQLGVRVNSLAGLYANIDPRVEIAGNATINNGQLTSADFSLLAAADLNVGFSILGVGNVDPPLAAFPIFNYRWSTNYPPPGQLTIRTQPRRQEVVVGGSASFSVDAVAGQAIRYQWYSNGTNLMLGNTGPCLTLSFVNLSHAGTYSVKLTSGGQTLWSSTATLAVRTSTTPSGMALIPAGSFTMGNCMDPNEGWSEELPLHSVYVSGFYMDVNLVSYSQWLTVYNWATSHGYSFEYGAQGKAANHPAHSMTWYDCVKWCNARSEKEGRGPAYYTDAGLSVRYRSGQVASYVNWSSGYRLPTEAEWEKAARGGASGQRFPWGNTISWGQANYYAYPLSAGGYAYDVNATSGYNPAWTSGGYPYTTAVGTFAANGYGLYDMAGNVFQWCWDWYDDAYYSSSPGTDPRGPVSGSLRVFRGGSWCDYGWFCRSACRYYGIPSYWGNKIGFRVVLTSGQ